MSKRAGRLVKEDCRHFDTLNYIHMDSRMKTVAMSLEIPTAGRWLQRPPPTCALSRGAWVEISAPSIGFCRRFRTHRSLPNPIFSRLAPALHLSTATFELPTLPSNHNSQSCFPPTTNDRSNSRHDKTTITICKSQQQQCLVNDLPRVLRPRAPPCPPAPAPRLRASTRLARRPPTPRPPPRHAPPRPQPPPPLPVVALACSDRWPALLRTSPSSPYIPALPLMGGNR